MYNRNRIRRQDPIKHPPTALRRSRKPLNRNWDNSRLIIQEIKPINIRIRLLIVSHSLNQSIPPSNDTNETTYSP